MVNLPRASKLRTLLVLGRVSNLPTVWSNCLAGWWLAGGGLRWKLVIVSIAVTCLYLGGMFLNDAFDAGFDRNHRPTRPIPSGGITEKEVWAWGFAWLGIGLISLVCMGGVTGILGLFLSGCILFYNAVHKIMAVGPIFMGLCRLFVYLVAASVGFYGVTGECIWKGLALAVYIIGLSCIARKESASVRVQYWPCLLLSAPILMGFLIDDGADSGAALWGSLILAVWVGWTILQIRGREQPNIGRAVSRLLAGIALVDLLAVADFSQPAALLFILCFLLALGLQAFIPAT